MVQSFEELSTNEQKAVGGVHGGAVGGRIGGQCLCLRLNCDMTAAIVWCCRLI